MGYSKRSIRNLIRRKKNTNVSDESENSDNSLQQGNDDRNFDSREHSNDSPQSSVATTFEEDNDNDSTSYNIITNLALVAFCERVQNVSQLSEETINSQDNLTDQFFDHNHDDDEKDDQSFTHDDDDHHNEFLHQDDEGKYHEHQGIDGGVSHDHITQSQEEMQHQDLMLEEIATYQLITLLDEAGAPRNCYDKLITLLRKQEKLGFRPSKAMYRDTFLKRMQERYECPSVTVAIVGQCDVYRFPFEEMLQNLVDSCQDHIHYVGRDPSDAEAELWNSPWIAQTLSLPKYRQYDSTRQILLPLVMYMDKTGTDAYQRYSLEPVLFSLACLPLSQRAKRHAWRHLGFIPALSEAQEDKEEKDSTANIQFYHRCMHSLLQGVRDAQRTPPKLKVVVNGQEEFLEVLVPLMVVMGDQLSQDTLCARKKANRGGAGRVHRACMCSYMSVDDPEGVCMAVDSQHLQMMTHEALMSEKSFHQLIEEEHAITDKLLAKDMKSAESKYFRRRRELFTKLLARPYQCHAIDNGFEGVDFGAWSHGVYDATFDDFMHSAESGPIAYAGKVIFDGLSEKESSRVETLIRSLLYPARSSARDEYPRWRIQKGFSRQTLMTSGERSGSLLALAISLHNKDVRKIFMDAHERQRKKYFKNPIQSISKATDTVPEEVTEKLLEEEEDMQPEDIQPQEVKHYFECHFKTCSTRTDAEIQATRAEIQETLKHMSRHGFDIEWLCGLDDLQINQAYFSSRDILGKLRFPEGYPNQNIGTYYRSQDKVRIPEHIITLVQKAVSETSPDQRLRTRHRQRVDPFIQKHYLVKPPKKGTGSTCAVMSPTGAGLTFVLDFVLAFHAFATYSASLPQVLREKYELVDYSGRNFVRYFNAAFYRGDGTIDNRTTKIHAQRRTGWNYRNLATTLMHSSCQTGERLLKTEAKGISRTAQQRGRSIFERQTCSRIHDRMIMDKVCGEVELHEGRVDYQCTPNKREMPSRKQPNFKLLAAKGNSARVLVAVDRRRGKYFHPNTKTGTVDPIVLGFLEKEQQSDIDIFNEVVINGEEKLRIRAYPNYKQSGPWYDFVLVKWGDDPGDLLPARILCLYRESINREEGKEEVLKALIHDIDPNAFENTLMDSMLIKHYHLGFDVGMPGQRKQPTVQSVEISSIERPIMCFLHRPMNGSGLTFDPDGRKFMVLRPRSEWPLVWLAWNSLLKEENTPAKVRRRGGVFLSLGDMKIRRKLSQRIADLEQEVQEANESLS